MAYLNVNIPVTYAQVRREYLYDLSGHVGEVEDCIIFGMASITGKALLFHAIMENGVVFYRLPISAFIQRGFNVKDVPRMRLDELELWNCFSYYPAITVYDILAGQSATTLTVSAKISSSSAKVVSTLVRAVCDSVDIVT